VNPENYNEEVLAGATVLEGNQVNLVTSFVETLAASSVRSREQDYQHFSTELAQALDGLRKDPRPSALLKCTDTVLPTLERYQRNTQRHIDGLISQLRGIIRTLISTIAAIRSDADGPELAAIEEQIMELQTVEGLAVARENLELALRQLTKAERLRKQEASSLLTRLHERVLILEDYANPATPAAAQPSQGQVDTGPARPAKPQANTSPVQPVAGKSGLPSLPQASVDRLTGLANRDAAEASILALEAHPGNKYIAAFYIQNMQQLNVRFGEKIGDELLFLMTQRIATNLLRPSDQIFRWRGPAFVAILEREESYAYVGHDLKRFVEHPFQFEFRSGSLLVFISIAAELLSAAVGTPAEHILQLEKYFSSF
jgi:diguanylate cyclase (GGDEF)-like protein